MLAFLRDPKQSPALARPGALARRGRAVAAGLLGSAALALAPAWAATCDQSWQLSAQLDSSPRSLTVTLRLPAAGRSRTLLRLPAGWQGLQPDDEATQALQPVAGDASLRRLDHAASGELVLRWRVQPSPGDPALRLERDWVAVFGQAVLPVPEAASDGRPQALCVALDGVPAGSRYIASAGLADRGAPGSWQFSGPAAQLQMALFAGGALQSQSRTAEGQALTVWAPATTTAPGSTTAPDRPDRLAALADTAAAAVAQQRRFWRDADAPPLTALLLPVPSGSAPEGSALGAAAGGLLLLQVPADAAAVDSGLMAAWTEALLRQRLPDRLGPQVVSGRRDEALRAWLGEGLVAFYTHRLLLATGAWTADDYAAELNRRIARYQASPALQADNLRVATGWMTDTALAALPAARGEWLMLHWHQALRAAGKPGLDAVLRPLMLPAAQARREGPMSAPLGQHRLLLALRHQLGDQPLRDITQWIDRGEAFAFQPETLGPCFRMATVPLTAWRLGFDRASLATGVLRGVEPDGPAAAAGLRDGQRLVGHSVVVGDTQQDVTLLLQADDGSRSTVRYRPTSPGAAPQGTLALYQAQPDALHQPACRGWLDGDAASAQAYASALRRTTAQPVAAEADDDEDAPAARPATKCSPVRVKAAKGAKGAKAQKGLKSAKAKTVMKCVPVKGAQARGHGSAKGAKAAASKPGKAAKGAKSGKSKGTKGTKATKGKSSANAARKGQRH